MVCVLIYLFRVNTIDMSIIWIFASLFTFVYLSIIIMHYFKIINPLQGSIDRTVKEMIKNDMVKDVKELEMFGSPLNERKVSLFRHSNNESLWMRAFKSVNVENMKYLLNIDQNIDVNEQDQENGRTAIIYASIKNNINAIKLLLSQPQIDVNKCDNDGYTALIYGVENECFEIIQLLLEAGADVNISPNDTGQSPIICCAVNNSINIAKLLLNQEQINVNEYDKNGCSALLYGVKNGYFEMTKLLIESGADINQTEKWDGSIDNNETPLIIALKKKYIEIVLWMLDNGVEYGLDTSTPKDSEVLPVRVRCWHTQNQDIVDKYQEFENENKNENSPNENHNYDWITETRLWNELQDGNPFFGCQMIAYSTNSGIKLNTSVIDKNGQTLWVYCWKSKHVRLMTEYIRYHEINNTKWDIFEMDWENKNNALTYMFSKLIVSTNGSVSSDDELALLQKLINQFVNEFVLCANSSIQFKWPTKNHCGSILEWLFSQLNIEKHHFAIAAWKKKIGVRAFSIVCEAIAVILRNLDIDSDGFGKSEMTMVKTISKVRWMHFLQPSNSLKCIEYLVQCIIDPKHPIKVENILTLTNMYDTILVMFAQYPSLEENDDDEYFTNKCDELIKWLKYEYGRAESRDDVVKFINRHSKQLKITPIAHAVANKHYYLAKLILNAFGYNVNLTVEYYHQDSQSNSTFSTRSRSTWLDIVESKEMELIQLAVAAFVNDENDESDCNDSNRHMIMNDIFSSLSDRDCKSICCGIHDDTPLFWAVNNQLYPILHLMLNTKPQRKTNILDPLAADELKHSIWEYVTGLPNIYKLKELNNNNYTKDKQMRVANKYNIDNIDIESMKLLIEKHKINVNRCDSFGKQALYRVCSIEYDKNDFNNQFDTQYQAVKLLFENGAKIFKQRQLDDTVSNFNVWTTLLLQIMDKETKISINDRSQIRKHIAANVFDQSQRSVNSKIGNDQSS